jgi:hypothetical protein
MRKYLPAFCAAAAILIILGVTAYFFFEVYPRKRYDPPSGEARSNDYLALDRWLTRTGHPVRIGLSGDSALIKAADERTVFVQASLFDWSGVSGELEPWIRGGGALVISLDTPWDEDNSAFLNALGISGADKPGGPSAPEEPAPPEPRFDRRVAFTVTGEVKNNPAAAVMTGAGAIRLVTVPLGEGSVTVTGIPYFMKSVNLDEEQNARLAWELTGGRDRDKRGIFFIRGAPAAADGPEGFLEKLARQGHILALAVSILVITAAGFWMVIPRFGVIEKDGDPAAKPIRERFLAEARFLGKYHALGSYLDVYVHELTAEIRRREGDISDEELIARIREIPGLRDLDRVLRGGQRISRRDFVKYRKAIETIRERL